MAGLKYEAGWGNDVDILESSTMSINLEMALDTTSERVRTTKPKFPGKLHALKVASELDVSDGLIYLRGEVEVPYRDSDQMRPFRQCRYFYYLAGLDFAGCAVTYDIKADRLILWIPHNDPRDILWRGRVPSARDCAIRCDVDYVRDIGQLPTHLHWYFGRQDKATVYTNRLESSQLDSEWGVEFATKYDICVESTALRPAMDEARVIKTDYEVDLIRRANQLSSAAHLKIQKLIRGLSTEMEVEAIFAEKCTANGAKKQSYPIIAGSGENAAILHYEDNDQPLGDKMFLLLDGGCEIECYASDITRTMPISDGRVTRQGIEIHRLVRNMQQQVIDQIRPGVDFTSLHLLAARVGMEGLLKMGVLKGDAESVWKAGTMAAFFPHGLGHHVGLEVHDVSGKHKLLGPRSAVDALCAEKTNGVVRARGGRKRDAILPEDLSAMVVEYAAMGHQTASGVFQALEKGDSADDSKRGLRQGMVVTVEPGIYFCRDYLEARFLDHPVHSGFIDWDVVAGCYGIGGVRIEDDILVVNGGYENLTTAPADLEDIFTLWQADGDAAS